MPSEIMPRSLPFLIFTPPGRCAPSSATGTSWPAATLGAPHTMCSVSGPPTSTVHSCRCVPSTSVHVSTRPTTTFSMPPLISSVPSTAVPVIIIRWVYSSGVTGISAYCRIIFIASFTENASLLPAYLSCPKRRASPS